MLLLGLWTGGSCLSLACLSSPVLVVPPGEFLDVRSEITAHFSLQLLPVRAEVVQSVFLNCRLWVRAAQQLTAAVPAVLAPLSDQTALVLPCRTPLAPHTQQGRL